jgi:hypothetical protein
VFGKGAKHASWTFQVALPAGQRCTLFGVNANGTVWPNWQKLPVDIAERYKLRLSLAPRFKTAIDAGKAWCESNMKEALVLPALQAAVDAIVSQLGVRLTVEAPNDTDEALPDGYPHRAGVTDQADL